MISLPMMQGRPRATLQPGLVILNKGGSASALLSRSPGSWELITVPAHTCTAGTYAPNFDINGGLFVAVGPSTSMTSQDGVNWTKTVIASIQTGNRSGVAWSQPLGLFAYVADSGILTSPDGITWTSRTNPGTLPACVIWSDTHSLFIAGNAGSAVNGIMTSPDGINWTLRSTPQSCYAVAANGSRIVCQEGGDLKSYTSDDGTTYGNVQSVPTGAFQQMVFGNGVFACVDQGGGGRGVTSSSGDVWTEAADVPDNGWARMVYSSDRGLFYCSGSASVVPDTLVIRSSNGSTWTFETVPSGANAVDWYPIMAGNIPPP